MAGRKKTSNSKKRVSKKKGRGRPASKKKAASVVKKRRSKKRTSQKKKSSKPRMSEFTKPGAEPPRFSRGGALAPPKRIFAQASVVSLGGHSMFDYGAAITAENSAAFTSEQALVQSAAEKLLDAGFEVLQATDSTINICGSASTFEKAFGGNIHVEQREVVKEFGKEDLAEFMECDNCELPGLVSTSGSAFEGLLEGVALEEPMYFMAANAFPPSVDYWHLDVPADVSLGCNADLAHRGGITGKGVVVSMVDSGWFRHPFFTQRGYRVEDTVLGPGASLPQDDESGHGTGESANIFSLAPDAILKPVKMNFVNSIGAFNVAVGMNPDIITCSWGSSKRDGALSAANIAMANAIAAAVSSGIIVVFSAGNGHWGFPGQHPDVISAGGVDISRDGSLRASDYSSGFASNIYSGRTVPDVCGLVGMSPMAMNILLPLQPGDSIDVGNSGGSHPSTGDETASDDGWAAFSGTSAAAPQLAGAAALIKQSCSRLSPSAVRDIMKSTARDVTVGNCHPNTGSNPATNGHDLATGHGLIDAHRASLVARVRCRPIIQPVRPPILPIEPIRPPIEPIRPPIRPPIQPIRPPIRPPIGITDREVAEQASERGGMDLTDLDLDAIEDMITHGQLDPTDI